MRNIQIVLNAILSKNIFEYILIDKNLNVVSTSEGVDKYLNSTPSEGDDVLDYLPELVGSENEIKTIFAKKYCLYSLESVFKNEYYINITVEYCDPETAIILLHNITATTLAKQTLLQYSNESTLLYTMLQKVVDRQNTLLFVTNSDKIEFANQKFLDYFDSNDIEDIRKKELNLYEKFDKNLKSYDKLFDRLNAKEEYIKIGNDTFIVHATLVESTHKLFTLAKVTYLSNKAQRDSLTGAYKKIYIHTKLEEMIKEKKECSLAVIDLDNFKKINDTYGHQVGDNVLKEFVIFINSHIRKNDTLARWGGEEFLLLLEESSFENSVKRIKDICKILDEYSFSTIGRLTASFGITYLNENDDADTVLKRADKALYEAKANGKNQVVLKKS